LHAIYVQNTHDRLQKTIKTDQKPSAHLSTTNKLYNRIQTPLYLSALDFFNPNPNFLFGNCRSESRGFGGGCGGPEVDEAVESEVRNKVLGGEDLHGGGTGVVTGVEPMLNTGAIVCDAGAETYGRLHYVERDRTAKEAGYS
jgi:hypothetical protein